MCCAGRLDDQDATCRWVLRSVTPEGRPGVILSGPSELRVSLYKSSHGNPISLSSFTKASSKLTLARRQATQDCSEGCFEPVIEVAVCIPKVQVYKLTHLRRPIFHQTGYLFLFTFMLFGSEIKRSLDLFARIPAIDQVIFQNRLHQGGINTSEVRNYHAYILVGSLCNGMLKTTYGKLSMCHPPLAFKTAYNVRTPRARRASL